MQELEIMIQENSEDCVINDRNYTCLCRLNAHEKVMQDIARGKTVLLLEYTVSEKEEYEHQMTLILGNLHTGNEELSSIQIAFLNQPDPEQIVPLAERLEEEMKADKQLRGLILPVGYGYTNREDGTWTCYVLSSLPDGFLENYIPYSALIQNQNISLPGRVLAALNLSDLMDGLMTLAESLLSSLHADHIYINPKTGDVKTSLLRWLMPEDSSTLKPEPCYSPEWMETQTELLTGSQGINHFLAYTLFRLFCVDDPYDGSDTLIEYPCLTEEALLQIHGSRAQFIMNNQKNACSAYIGQTARKQWNYLPEFLRSAFERAFTEGVENPAQRPDTKEWLTTMRKVRDCLVFVNNQYRLSDPQKAASVLYIKANGYMIPVWSRKALYWYHLNLPDDYAYTGENGLIGGIDSTQALCNKSKENWIICGADQQYVVEPEQKFIPGKGMHILMNGNCMVEIVAGGSDRKITMEVSEEIEPTEDMTLKTTPLPTEDMTLKTTPLPTEDIAQKINPELTDDLPSTDSDHTDVPETSEGDMELTLDLFADAEEDTEVITDGSK